MNLRNLPLLAVFAAVARNRSVTAAARELGFTKSMVSAQLRALEEQVGVRLVERTTRSMQLTSVGFDVHTAAERMLAEARAVSEVVAAHRDQPSGHIRVGVPHGLVGTVAGVTSALVRGYGGLTIEIVADDSMQDLVKQGLDVVVRMGTPRDSTYVIRKISESNVVLVASPALGLPITGRPSDLGTAPWVRYAPVQTGDRWTFTGPNGVKETVKPNVRVAANTMDGFRDLILGGAGIGAIPEVHVAEALRSGAAVRLCAGWQRRRISIFALVAGRRSRPHVDVFLRALRTALGRGPADPLSSDHVAELGRARLPFRSQLSPDKKLEIAP